MTEERLTFFDSTVSVCLVVCPMDRRIVRSRERRSCAIIASAIKIELRRRKKDVELLSWWGNEREWAIVVKYDRSLSYWNAFGMVAQDCLRMSACFSGTGMNEIRTLFTIAAFQLQSRGFLIPFIFRVLFFGPLIWVGLYGSLSSSVSLKLLWRWGSAEYWQIFSRPLKWEFILLLRLDLAFVLALFDSDFVAGWFVSLFTSIKTSE